MPVLQDDVGPRREQHLEQRRRGEAAEPGRQVAGAQPVQIEGQHGQGEIEVDLGCDYKGAVLDAIQGKLWRVGATERPSKPPWRALERNRSIRPTEFSESDCTGKPPDLGRCCLFLHGRCCKDFRKNSVTLPVSRKHLEALLASSEPWGPEWISLEVPRQAAPPTTANIQNCWNAILGLQHHLFDGCGANGPCSGCSRAYARDLAYHLPPKRIAVEAP